MPKKILLILVFSLLIGYPVIGNNKSLNLTGKLFIMGNQPFTRLVCQTEQQKYIITGELLPELKNIQGAMVKIEGSEAGNSEYGLPMVNVAKYQILGVGEGANRKTPWVGVLKLKGTDLYLELSAGKMYKLSGPILPELKKSSGAKVWITGSLKSKAFSASIITPDAYQIIKKANSDQD